MKITVHISFFYIEKRIRYINQIIGETNQYDHPTDIFIHTNNPDLQASDFDRYTNGTIQIVWHDLTGIHPYYLTWKCRALLREQRNNYDIFMYIEDDILVPRKAIAYWLEHHELLVSKGYNLGFARIDTAEDGEEYMTDLYGERLDTLGISNNNVYCVNNKNPYCAFWIYDKREFNRFVDSIYYDIRNIPEYAVREMSAIGLHGITNYWYKKTLIPIICGQLHRDCRVYHLPSNYVSDKDSLFATIKFTEAIENLP